jgi:hypothetical protein
MSCVTHSFSLKFNISVFFRHDIKTSNCFPEIKFVLKTLYMTSNFFKVTILDPCRGGPGGGAFLLELEFCSAYFFSSAIQF